MRILLVDDNETFRGAVRECVCRAPGAQVVGVAGNGRDAVELAETLSPDVIFMDISMPIMNGIEATRQITRTSPARIIILSIYGEQEYVSEAVQAGAKGYLLKTAPCAEMLAAMAAVMLGQTYLGMGIG